MMDIKPIETVYKGYRFRSRLEARWAVYLDNMNIKWEYEPEGFEFKNGERYLPDFLIFNHLGAPVQWLEIKGIPTDLKYESKLQYLAQETNMSVYVLYGPPGDVKVKRFFPDGGGKPADMSGIATWWILPVTTEQYKEIKNTPRDISNRQFFRLPWVNKISKKEDLAINKARQARFEHGETPL